MFLTPLILKGLFQGRKFFEFPPLQKDFSLYIKVNIFEQLIFSQKEIIFLSFSRGNLRNVSTSCFHYERYISQKRICLIDPSTEGFHPVHSD